MQHKYYKIDHADYSGNREVLAFKSRFGLYRNLLATDYLSFHELAGRIKRHCDYHDEKMPTEHELGFALLKLLQEDLVGMTQTNTLYVNFKKLHPDATLPTFGSAKAAGLDLYSIEDVKLPPFTRAGIKTGLAVDLPVYTEMEVRPRSGLAFKKGFTVLNSPGTIDEDYTGEIVIIGINLSHDTMVINKGDRIAQGCVRQIPQVVVGETKDLKTTERGTGGFGSTGA